jgi:hypothetical protein
LSDAGTMKARYLVVAALVLLVATACAGGANDSGRSRTSQPNATYSANGVEFEYPESWDRFPAEPATATEGSNELWSVTVGPDKTNLVNVTAYRLKIEVTDDNLSSIEAELDDVISGIVERAGGTIADGPTADEVAGYPAYTYSWQGVEVSGEPKDSAAYFIFVGDTEYFINCQFSDETADDIEAGCDTVLDSFEVAAEDG